MPKDRPPADRTGGKRSCGLEAWLQRGRRHHSGGRGGESKYQRPAYDREVLAMETAIFRLIGGCAFILFAKWAYRNPGTMIHARTFYKNPDSAFLVGIVRTFAAMLALVGSFSVLTVITEHVFNGLPGAFVALALSGGAVWLLLRGVSRTPRPTAAPKGGAGFLTSRGKWFVGISLAVATAFAVAVTIFAFLHRP
jgi:hypothetical protein